MKKAEIFYLLKSMNLDFEAEHRFDPKRQFKFDFAIPDKKIAIEYEGIVTSKKPSRKIVNGKLVEIKRRSRHTSITGYTNDCTKYNLGQKNGWIVLRYTALNLSDLINDLEDLIK